MTQPTAAATRTRVYVDRKLIAGGQIIVKNGVTYVDTAALADAIGATIQSTKAAVTITTTQQSN